MAFCSSEQNSRVSYRVMTSSSTRKFERRCYSYVSADKKYRELFRRLVTFGRAWPIFDKTSDIRSLTCREIVKNE